MSNKNKFWDQAEDLIKSYNLKPRDFKASDNWNKESSLQALEAKLKAGSKKGSDNRTFRNDKGELEVKVKDWMTKEEGQKVADETGAKMPTAKNQSSWAKGTKAGDPGGAGKYGSWQDMGEGFRAQGWFGLDDLAQVNKWKGKDLLKSWLDKGDHRGLGGVEAIGKGVAADLWGYTNPGDSGDAFGKKDIEELQAAGATDSHIKKIREGFLRRKAQVGPWAMTDKNWATKSPPSGSAGGGGGGGPGTGGSGGGSGGSGGTTSGGSNTASSTPTGNPWQTNVPDDPKFFSADSMQAGSGASGVAARRSKQSKWSLLSGQGSKQLGRNFKNLSLRIN